MDGRTAGQSTGKHDASLLIVKIAEFSIYDRKGRRGGGLPVIMLSASL